MDNLVEVMKKYNMSIVALQEIRWKGAEILKQKDFTVFYSGHEENTFGTGFIVDNRIANAVIGFKPVCERLCSIRLSGKFFNTTFICGHAPTEETEDSKKDEFYGKLERMYDAAPRHDVKIILGDMNAKVGREEVFRNIIGRDSLHNECNENGMRLVDFAASRRMMVSSTRFPRKSIHKATWRSPDGFTRNQIDHVLIDARHGTDIQFVRTCRGADIDSDHFLVKAYYKQRICRIKNIRTSRTQKYDGQKLMEDKEIADEFVATVERKLTNDDKITGSVEEQWRDIKMAIQTTAESVVGFGQQEKRKRWFDEECERAIEERNQARLKMIQRDTRGNRNAYTETRRGAKRICTKKKREWEREKMEKVEVLARTKDFRQMYALIREEKRGFQARSSMCEDKDGNLVVEPRKVLERWTEHFQEILNGTDEKGIEEEEGYYLPGPDVEMHELGLAETKEAIKGMKNNKAPGEDNITAELIKYGGDILHSKMHQLMLRIWQEEQMPEEWRVALLCPIHKKGSKLCCGNYRGISLLNLGYKVFTKILARRLEPFAEQVLGDYQSGFRRNRSTTDHIFTLRCILEKFYEYNVPVHQLYVDFETAYDSIDRKYLYETLDELGIPRKLTRLVKMTLDLSSCKIKAQNELSKEFRVNRGLRQGDSLSCILFNLTLERVVRSIDVREGALARYIRGRNPIQTGTLYNQSVQYLAYADDVAMLGRTAKNVSIAYDELEEEAGKAGLNVNVGKTKYMLLSQDKGSSDNLTVNGKVFEHVSSFKYLGSRLTEDNDTMTEIRERITQGNRCFFSLLKALKSRTISRRIKKRIYRTVIRPVVTHGSETWVLTKRGEEVLDRWERKILRKIYGPVQENGGWRIRHNVELYNLYQEPRISVEVRKGRLRWVGHLERMEKNRAARQVFYRHPEGRRRPRRRPRKRWLDEVEEDLRQMQVRGWRRLALDHEAWTEVIEKARALQEL